MSYLGLEHRPLRFADWMALPESWERIEFLGGELFVTLDHGGGLASTYSWLSATVVRKGDVVALGQTIGSTGSGHPGASIPHLHLGMKLDGAYLDPLEVLGPLGVQDFIRLVPLAA